MAAKAPSRDEDMDNEQRAKEKEGFHDALESERQSLLRLTDQARDRFNEVFDLTKDLPDGRAREIMAQWKHGVSTLPLAQLAILDVKGLVAGVPERPVFGPPRPPVAAVMVRCDGEKHTFGMWHATAVPHGDAMFAKNPAPVSALLGLPLVFRREGTRADNSAKLDCQIATYLNIDPESGFAPPEWQSSVGSVVVGRKDKKPLLPHHLEGLWMYCDLILDYFGDAVGPPRHMYTRAAFEEWWVNYCEEQLDCRGGTKGETDPDDWRNVKSPYAM